MRKRTTLELTINPGYVKSWGTWEACREIIQNALDAQDEGYPASISFKRGVLKVVNQGVTLSRESLLLGTSTKEPGTARGQFGEGYKLAWLVLLRQGLGVLCKSGAEIWQPKLAPSANFGADTLQVALRPAVHENLVAVEISGLQDSDWETIKGRVRPLTEGVKQEGLLGEAANKGKLFVKGLFVADLGADYAFGYDLPALKLDRDRKLADPWDLQYAIAKALNRKQQDAPFTEAELLDLLKTAPKELEAASNATWLSREFCKALGNAFQAAYGADATPISSDSELLEAPHYGLAPIFVSKYAAACLNEAGLSLENQKSTKRFDVLKTYILSDFPPKIAGLVCSAVGLLTCACKRHKVNLPDLVEIVDFRDANVSGLSERKDGAIAVKIARKELTSLGHVTAILVHEFAHDVGGDASIEHRSTCEALFADIIDQLSSEVRDED